MVLIWNFDHLDPPQSKILAMCLFFSIELTCHARMSLDYGHSQFSEHPQSGIDVILNISQEYVVGQRVIVEQQQGTKAQNQAQKTEFGNFENQIDFAGCLILQELKALLEYSVNIILGEVMPGCELLDFPDPLSVATDIHQKKIGTMSRCNFTFFFTTHA